MIRVMIAIDNRLYYQADIQTDDVQATVKGVVVEIAGSLWKRAEWHTEESTGVIANKESEKVRASTKYQVNQYSNVCVNPDCAWGLPRYRKFGKPSHKRCGMCGGLMVRIQGEPRGTYHPPRR